MEYVYAALLLHKSGKEVNEENVKKVLTAAGITVNEARVKSMIAALEGVNIDEAIEKAAPMAAVAAPAPTAGEAPKKEEKKKEEEKPSEEQAAAGLGSLFG